MFLVARLVNFRGIFVFLRRAFISIQINLGLSAIKLTTDSLLVSWQNFIILPNSFSSIFKLIYNFLPQELALSMCLIVLIFFLNKLRVVSSYLVNMRVSILTLILFSRKVHVYIHDLYFIRSRENGDIYFPS